MLYLADAIPALSGAIASLPARSAFELAAIALAIESSFVA